MEKEINQVCWERNIKRIKEGMENDQKKKALKGSDKQEYQKTERRLRMRKKEWQKNWEKEILKEITSKLSGYFETRGLL